jgi:exosortase F-associated protein
MVLLLVLVRAYEDVLFYDPFVQYFKFDYLKGGFPVFVMGPLLLDLFARYIVNTVLSLIIIYMAYLNKENLFFAIKLYALTFAIIGLLYFIYLKIEFPNGYLFAFYLRRILIHPLLLLILLPSFYFQKKMKVKV